MNSPELAAIPEPHADTAKKIELIIKIVRRPNLSAKVPAKNAPTAQPSSIEATLNPVPMLSESKAPFSPSTVPLMTPLSNPNKKPPIVATMLIKITKRVLWESGADICNKWFN